MKAKQVIKLLGVTRPTLTKYVKLGKLKVTPLPNHFYDYDEESVYKLLNKGLARKSVIYCRVSTTNQKKELENQQKTLEEFCVKNRIVVDGVYSDVGSGINFDRKEFKKLLFDVINHRISKIYVTYKDRLSRLSFDTFKQLFEEFNCEIVAINNVDDEKMIEKEVFNEIISMLHFFEEKVYSYRRKKKLKTVAEDLSLEDDLNDENCK